MGRSATVGARLSEPAPLAGALTALAAIGQAFGQCTPFERQLEAALQQVGRLLQVSRVLAFHSGRARTTHEWCAEGVVRRDGLPRLDPEALTTWRRLLDEGELCAEGLDALSPELARPLQELGVEALLGMPLRNAGERYGFLLAVEERGSATQGRGRRWSPAEQEFLRAAAAMVGLAWSREASADAECNAQAITEALEDLLFVVDGADGRVLHANRAAVAALGYTSEQLHRMEVLDLHPPELREEARTTLAEILAGRRDLCPLPLRRQDGKRLEVETRVCRATWNGKPCLVGLSKDLSAQVAALEWFNQLFDHNPSPMAVARLPDRVVTQVNRAFLEKLGLSEEEVVGRSTAELKLFVDGDAEEQIARALQPSGRFQDLELRVRRKDGTVLVGLLSGVVVDDQRQRSLLTVMADVTPQVELRRQIEEQRTRLENILEGTDAGTWEWNVQTGVTVFNERWAQIVGYTLAELQPTSVETWAKLAHPEDLQESNRRLQEHFEGRAGFYAVEARMRHKAGHWVWVRDHGRVAVWDQQGKPLIMFGTHIDITEGKHIAEQLHEASIRDPLTGLFNRRHAFERLDEMVAKCRRGLGSLALALIDLDHFKAVNDEYGHPAGDEVLRGVAEAMVQNQRPYDLFARYGGEEFLLVFEQTDRRVAAQIVERALASLRERRWYFGDAAVRTTFSAGVTDSLEFDPATLTGAALVERADRRLYEAKLEGRNQVVAGLD